MRKIKQKDKIPETENQNQAFTKQWQQPCEAGLKYNHSRLKQQYGWIANSKKKVGEERGRTE